MSSRHSALSSPSDSASPMYGWTTALSMFATFVPRRMRKYPQSSPGFAPAGGGQERHVFGHASSWPRSGYVKHRGSYSLYHVQSLPKTSVNAGASSQFGLRFVPDAHNTPWQS